MKFQSQVAGLIAVIKPMHTVATKGIIKDHPLAGLLTFNASDSLCIIADGGHVNGINTIDSASNSIDYKCMQKGSVTISANDLISALSSFVSNDVVEIETKDAENGSEVIIRSCTDADEMQTLPILNTECVFNNTQQKKSIENSIKLNRNLFIQYANKVSFAHGDQQQFKQFTYWIMRSFDNDSLRFVAGTGQIFAVVDLEGKNISSCSKNISVLFPNVQTQTLLSVLGDAKSDAIIIETHDNYIFVDAQNIKLKISNLDPSVKWPDENKFLQRNSKISFTTKVGNWKNAVKGINATNNDDFRKQNKIHHCSLSIDLKKKVIQAKTTDSTLKSNRKIPIEDIGTDENINEMQIRCVSSYFNDIVNKASDNENLQFEMLDAANPIVVRYYADSVVGDYRNFKKDSDNGIAERYSVFFAIAR